MARMTSPDEAMQRVIAAIEARDDSAYSVAFHGLVQACKDADPGDLRLALERLAPVLGAVPLAPATGLARLAGTLANRLPDTAPILGVLVDRACQATEDAAYFLMLHRELLGEPPAPEDMSAAKETLDRFGAAARDRAPAPWLLVDAWFAGPDWVRPVLFLSQRADVRAALPQRERLLAAVASIQEEFENADWLYGLLLVLDRAPIVVLHRATGRGYRVTIGGVGNNYQLHTLLAARLIGDPDAGWLPGTPPTPEMTAAADGSGPPDPPGGIDGQFGLVDVSGAPIPGEDRPADIPLFDGERIVILDPLPYEQNWTAGRVYPLMRPTVRVDGQLTTEEAAARLARARPAPRGELPIGWTDDLSIPLRRGRTAAEVVDLALDAARRDLSAEEIVAALVREFGLSDDDARLAWDRTCGGLVRAASRNPGNCPAREKDPLAWESFQRGVRDPSVIARVYPEFSPDR